MVHLPIIKGIAVSTINKNDIRYVIGRIFVGQNWRKFDLVTKILSDNNFLQYVSKKVRQKSDKLTKFRLDDQNILSNVFFARQGRIGI